MTELTQPARTKWILAPDLATGEIERAGLPDPAAWAIVTPRVHEFAPGLPGAVVSEYLVAEWPDDAPLEQLRRRDDVIELLEERMSEEVA